ncbi:zygote arrest protein 1 [Rattus norvegicus]|uniref:Zygote arrest protein 1 n=2 Tax=Rattus norvegicus TaxID=10116 RepID=ZAR1_RAT|nr:zygote arrest protein 1 [Rattus norvegicus]Q7TSX9.1 RecName: Full=Zygote arrest protein 1 [Rattus norvegicus]AAP37037.1 zygote arrest 1 [Rattus norvegicus]|eukprot:NP_852050.1 zygote arrest protein 1 [Rattus norvegicus]
MFPASTPHPCPHPYPPTAAKAGDGWRFGARGCRPEPPSFLPGYRQLMAAEYFDSYQRAQLMALLSRMGPRPVSSRDAAVQVNPRRDASVQCSLGRRTLQPGRRRASPDARPGSCQPRSPARAGRPPRSWRTVALYSPVTFGGLSSSLEVAGDRQTPTKGEGRPAPTGTREPEPGEVAVMKAVPQPQSEEGDVQAEGQDGQEQPPREDPDSVAAMQSEPGSEEPPPAVEMAQDPSDVAASRDRASPQSTEQDKERLRFQFLEQKYGYYHCKDCNIRWESAYVWCVQGTSKVYFKQFCRVCEKSYNPYRVEDITCQSCKRTRCACPVRLRHVDPKRPHRQDLCGRCKDKRLSCDSTFSFKYII